MIVPSDPDYIQARDIRRGKSAIKPEFRAFASWVGQTFGVRVLDIFYAEEVPVGPRLQVVLEFENDRHSFDDPQAPGNFDSKKRSLVLERFERDFSETFKIDGLGVVFTDFESVAKIEANDTIPEPDIEALKASLRTPDLWKIFRLFSEVIFFVYTDAQLRNVRGGPVEQRWAQKYFDILKPYDEFGYFKAESFSIRLDSKENFDKNYGGNWFHYTR